jgi:hypothetical protein
MVKLRSTLVGKQLKGKTVDRLEKGCAAKL